ncbi:MAG: aldo/keto reductase [Methanobrevibacter sp.]|nr:aldo/keto reductase [Methanobrevibacter sp.]
MIYRPLEKTNDDFSLLGYGCMRFPKKNGRIDIEESEKHIIHAIENGVNYFDTAYTYGGHEKALGSILSKGYRDKVKIATKLPIFNLKNREDMDKIFNTQLERLQTDHIDYYLIHGLSSFQQWEDVKTLGILEFIAEEQEKGRIINIGFSAHTNLVNFKKIVDDYNWDVAMIQYNYIDENYQAGTDGLNYAHSKGLGIIVMEPLRGGMLVDKLPKEAQKIFKDYKIKRSSAEWGFRWLADNPKINVVLSGMSTTEQLEENLKIFSNHQANSLSDEEKQIYNNVKDIFKCKLKVDCTGCGYCLPCPSNVDIPTCFSSYNDKAIFGSLMANIMYFVSTLENNSPAKNCTSCGVCVNKCPQNIPIVDEIKKVSKKMDIWILRQITKIAIKIIF